MSAGDNDMQVLAENERAAQRVARVGWFLLLVGLGGFLLWASLAPLDQGLVGSGTVVIAGEKKTVQSVLDGSIEQILVREGERVQQGQLLLRLNTVKARADVDLVTGQWINARAVQARLTAERMGGAAIEWPVVLRDRLADMRARDAMTLQQGLFETRAAELASRLQIIAHEEQALQEQLAGLEEMRRNYQTQLKYQTEELEGMRSLVKAGHVPRNRVYEEEKNAAQLNAQLASAVADIGRVRQSINESRLKALQQTQAFRHEVEEELSDVTANAAALEERLKSLDFELRHAELLAPVSGDVVGLSVHTEGGFVAEGQKLMDVVPSGSSWLVKARFEPMVADRLQTGLPVDVRFSSLQRIKTPVLQGRVSTVSADQLLDEYSKQPYFAAEILLDEPSVQAIQHTGLAIKPGMQAEVIVKTGERTLFNYLLRPVTEKMAGALKEE